MHKDIFIIILLKKETLQFKINLLIFSRNERELIKLWKSKEELIRQLIRQKYNEILKN